MNNDRSTHMRRPALVSVCLLALTAVLVVGASVTAAPGVDSAVGSGHLADGGRFQFNAKGDPSDASGHVRYDILFQGAPFAESKGTVECLDVVGNIATISGTFDDPAHTALPYFLLVIIDNGKGPADQAKVIISPDKIFQDADCGRARVEAFPPEIGAKVTAKVKDR